MISQAAIDEAIRGCPGCIVVRAVILDEVQSTQEAAFEAFSGDPVVVVASKQTSGRGQRGSRWEDGEHATLACTLAIGADGYDPCRLAAAAGLAALHAIKDACPSGSDLKIKWPNDVMVDGKKIAGVLIEIRDSVVLIGIGINCVAREWDKALGESAISIAEIDGNADRGFLACALIVQMSRWINADDEQTRSSWAACDAMVGTHRSFIVDNNEIQGEVVSIDPLTAIVVRTDDGLVHLPVQTTRNA